MIKKFEKIFTVPVTVKEVKITAVTADGIEVTAVMPISAFTNGGTDEDVPAPATADEYCCYGEADNPYDYCPAPPEEEPSVPELYKVKLFLRPGLSVLAPRPNGTGDWAVQATDEDCNKKYCVVIPKAVVESIPDWGELAKNANALTGADATILPVLCHLDKENGRIILVVEEILIIAT